MQQSNDIKNVFISIKGLPVYSIDDNDAFELMTDGEYYHSDNMSAFSYIESALTGIDGMLTTFEVKPGRIVLKRGDEFAGDMIFDEKEKQHFLYDTPYGSVLMGIDTHSITNCMNANGGNLEIRYDIEVDNVAISQNLFKINIKSMPQ